MKLYVWYIYIYIVREREIIAMISYVASFFYFLLFLHSHSFTIFWKILLSFSHCFYLFCLSSWMPLGRFCLCIEPKKSTDLRLLFWGRFCTHVVIFLQLYLPFAFALSFCLLPPVCSCLSSTISLSPFLSLSFGEPCHRQKLWRETIRLLSMKGTRPKLTTHCELKRKHEALNRRFTLRQIYPMDPHGFSS